MKRIESHLSLLNRIHDARSQFENEVASAISNTEEEVRAIANAIGEISIDEAKAAIIKIFTENLTEKI